MPTHKGSIERDVLISKIEIFYSSLNIQEKQLFLSKINPDFLRKTAGKLSFVDISTSFESPINCGEKIQYCKAMCCYFYTILQEGSYSREHTRVREEGGQIIIAKSNNSHKCIHLDCKTKGCGIYEDRPDLCASYDCRKDSRVWLDFDKNKVNIDYILNLFN